MVTRKNPKTGRRKRNTIFIVIFGMFVIAAAGTAWFLIGPGTAVFKDPTVTTLESSDTKAQKGDTDGAIRDLDAAATRASDPKEKAALYSKKSDLQADAGDDAAAAASAQQAVQAAPSEDTYRLLGLTLAADGQNAPAIAAYKKALAAYDAAHPDDRGHEADDRSYYLDQIQGLGGSI